MSDTIPQDTEAYESWLIEMAPIWAAERIRREGPRRRAIRRLATARGYTVTGLSWWRSATTPRQRTMADDGDDDGWVLDGGWQVQLMDSSGRDELVEGHQHELVMEAIARLPIGGYR